MQTKASQTAVLARGQFFGSSVASRELGGSCLTIRKYEAGTSLGWHGHGSPYLTFVLRGGYRERLRSRVRDCAEQQLVLHPAGEVHADEFAGASHLLNIELDAAWLRSVAVPESSLDSASVVASAEISAIMGRAAREIRITDAASSIVVEGLMLELLGELARQGSRDRAPHWLRGVRDEIAARFREPLSLARLAEIAAVHPVHLARSFRQHFGRTVGEEIRHQRIEHAKARIRAGVPLAEVALEAGFADQSHLTRTFRCITRLTPSEYRRAGRVPRR